MAFESSIEWTESTWNPVTGCTKTSPACAHCYAETFAERFRGTRGHPFEQGFDLKLWPERLGLPLTWKEPRMIFVNSMSDLFHKDVPDAFVAKVFDTMAQAHWHTFQLLTKRSKRLAGWAEAWGQWPSNVWAGVSVESQDYAWRADDLITVPADIRFLSIEPLLGPVRLKKSVLKRIQWVIVGGESGHHARPMRPEWARDLRDQCQELGVPFFFKQWGLHDAQGRRHRSKKQAGRVLDGRTWDSMPVLVGA